MQRNAIRMAPMVARHYADWVSQSRWHWFNPIYLPEWNRLSYHNSENTLWQTDFISPALPRERCRPSRLWHDIMPTGFRNRDVPELIPYIFLNEIYFRIIIQKIRWNKLILFHQRYPESAIAGQPAKRHSNGAEKVTMYNFKRASFFLRRIPASDISVWNKQILFHQRYPESAIGQPAKRHSNGSDGGTTLCGLGFAIKMPLEFSGLLEKLFFNPENTLSNVFFFFFHALSDSILAYWVILHASYRLLLFFRNHIFSKNYFMNTIGMSNSLDPGQARHIVGPLIWAKTVCKVISRFIHYPSY